MNMGPTPTPPGPIDVGVDGAISPPQGTSDAVDAMVCDRETIKVVKKVEFQLLCPQHNPVSCVWSELDVSPFLNVILAHARSEESQ